MISVPCTVTYEHLSGLALTHVHKDKTLDEERIIYQFSRLALILRPNEVAGSN